MIEAWNTIANMKVLDASLTSFFEVIESEIKGQSCWTLNGSERIHDQETPNGWCRYARYMRYSLSKIPRGEGRNRGPGHLTVGVELWREVMDERKIWIHAKQPLIYVGFWPKGNDWWNEWMALDCLGAPTDEEVVEPTKDAPYLWTYNGRDNSRWSLCDWFFVLRLCSIRCREDVLQEIVIPLRSLLVDDNDLHTAFGTTHAISTITDH